LIEIEAQILFLYPGSYKNFDDIEDNLTVEELEKMYSKAYELKEKEYRFLAAIQGIDIDEGQETEGEAVIRRAEAKALGVSEEQLYSEGAFSFTDE
jgi:hypothetical protein